MLNDLKWLESQSTQRDPHLLDVRRKSPDTELLTVGFFETVEYCIWMIN